mgnify:CR=1 FL=1
MDFGKQIGEGVGTGWWDEVEDLIPGVVLVVDEGRMDL